MEQIDLSNSPDLLELVEQLRSLAYEQQSDPLKLLEILRAIEYVHRDICENLFQPALPISRHELFNLLRDIEANGGWPYIYRLKLSELCGEAVDAMDGEDPHEDNMPFV